MFFVPLKEKEGWSKEKLLDPFGYDSSPPAIHDDFIFHAKNKKPGA